MKCNDWYCAKGGSSNDGSRQCCLRHDSTAEGRFDLTRTASDDMFITVRHATGMFKENK